MENITGTKIQLRLLVTDPPKIKWHQIVKKKKRNRMPQVTRQNKTVLGKKKKKKKSF